VSAAYLIIALPTGTQLTEYGAASNVFAPSKEDERSMALAARARKGDYDDGTFPLMKCLFNPD
jgi:hypothetical protein